MSFLFGPFYKLLLNKDIEERIIIKIKDIQSCSMWHNFDLAINKEKLDFSEINKDIILQEMNIWEDVSKLSAQYDSNDYRKRLETLGCVCKDGLWKCLKKPSEDTVKLNVFMFCLYRLLANEITQKICIVCACVIAHSDDKCNGCGATIVEEICLEKTNIENKLKKENVDIDQSNDDKINVNKTEVKPALKLKKRKEIPIENSETINTDANVAVNVGIEGAVKNELFGDGRVCDKCGSRVDGREKLCGKCVADNTDRKDQWRCGKCGLMHAYSVRICNGCDASRIGMGKWTCDKCTMVNNCTDVKCTVCDAPNDYLSAKYCEKCSTNKVPSNKRYCDGCEGCDNEWGPNKWWCPYMKCEVYNDNKDRYCRVCRLQRDYSRARGDNVKLWHDDTEKTVWICYKCNKINKSSALVCIDCRETRYKIRYCRKCQVCNDGTTNNCDKCYQKL